MGHRLILRSNVFLVYHPEKLRTRSPMMAYQAGGPFSHFNDIPNPRGRPPTLISCLSLLSMSVAPEVHCKGSKFLEESQEAANRGSIVGNELFINLTCIDD